LGDCNFREQQAGRDRSAGFIRLWNGVWTFSKTLNPEGMTSLSPGLRAERYPGWEPVGDKP
jgi:hypothetical protein